MNGRTAATLGFLLLSNARPADARDVVLASAIAQAKEKLAAPACLLVLEDFRDTAGRPLSEKLAATGLGAPAFLESLEFRDGRSEAICRRGRVDAFTSVGGSTVWTCPGGSLTLGAAETRSGPNALIHEMLHALGLSENPPTSLEITHQVGARCGL